MRPSTLVLAAGLLLSCAVAADAASGDTAAGAAAEQGLSAAPGIAGMPRRTQTMQTGVSQPGAMRARTMRGPHRRRR